MCGSATAWGLYKERRKSMGFGRCSLEPWQHEVTHDEGGENRGPFFSVWELYTFGPSLGPGCLALFEVTGLVAHKSSGTLFGLFKITP